MNVIERSILATDLAHHFKMAAEIRGLSQKVSTSKLSLDFDSPDKIVLEHSLMTAADLAATCKPWAVHRYVSHLISEEFWAQVR